ncbi:hypothetical protein CPHO_05955 [Corynebacterium phocae]|uniref:1-deoxy-D-xylulose-5-phosphate synthase n=1 Tax=Corynebacterium phocae TaxID=161895 RepID=A0A1L7D2Y9_9CORY|nr:DUF6676 family protein [Corynebacterium phocae]APT92509.1 hypothetical protein CPHO_05955 [Corynebacterium phocae]KAA8725113.1 hypothetical protein F4V58_05495 [Corynebacterium phocae]
MIPAGVDVSDLAAQLAEDRVAFSASTHTEGFDGPAQRGIQEVLRPGEGIAVVDVIPAKAADLRDVAQELADATGLETVIVQSPTDVSVVSSRYSRAEIESVQAQIAPGTEHTVVVEQLHEMGGGSGESWTLALVAFVALAAVAASVAWRSASAGLDRP